MTGEESADLSVVIPCYCASATIGRALLSVVDQTLPPRSVFLVEDDSPDDGATRDVLHALVDRYQGRNGVHIQVLLNETNVGPGMARNRAWDLAETRYIAFLDADDAWHPRKVALQYDWMRAHPEYALTGHLTEVRGKDDPVPDVNSDFGIREVGRTGLLTRNRFYTRTVMLDARLPYRFSDKRFSEDYGLWLEIVFDGRKACVLQTALACSFKTAYGESGLSARLWAMEQGELDNFRRLYGAGRISGPAFWLASAFSVFKYGVRFLRTAMRRSAAGTAGNGGTIETKADGQRGKVLYLVTEDWYFCVHWTSLAEAAKAAGYEVVVATRVQEQGERIRDAGLRLIPIRMRRRSLSPWRELVAILDLVGIYRRERPDVVHHVAMKPMIYGSIAAAIARVPVVVNAVTGLGFVFTSDRPKARLLRPLIVTAFRLLLVGRGKAVIVQNGDDRALLRRYLSTRDVRLIRGVGVDLEVFHPGSEPRTESPDAVPLVVLPARMLWDKGVGEFVDAARMLRKRGIRVRMALVGGQDEENPSSIPVGRLEQWRDEGDVEWWGYRTDMPDIYRQADVVCLPSYREGLPTVLLEAAACGRPLITTDVPGCREVVENGRNGLLVPARDAEALAQAVEKLVVDRDYAIRLGQAGLEEARESFSRDAVNDTTLDIYREMGTE